MPPESLLIRQVICTIRQPKHYRFAAQKLSLRCCIAVYHLRVKLLLSLTTLCPILRRPSTTNCASGREFHPAPCFLSLSQLTPPPPPPSPSPPPLPLPPPQPLHCQIIRSACRACCRRCGGEAYGSNPAAATAFAFILRFQPPQSSDVAASDVQCRFPTMKP